VAALSVDSVRGPTTETTPQEQLVRNLLTDTDPRSLGVEGLATRLERHVDDLKEQLARERREAAAATASPAGSTAELDHQMDVQALRDELRALHEQIAAERAAHEENLAHAASDRPPGRPPGRLDEPLPPPPAAPRRPVSGR
jgi:conjugal transfer pilus assembly protein TraB